MFLAQRTFFFFYINFLEERREQFAIGGNVFFVLQQFRGVEVGKEISHIIFTLFEWEGIKRMCGSFKNHFFWGFDKPVECQCPASQRRWHYRLRIFFIFFFSFFFYIAASLEP